jgi:hypothetical protein
MAQNQTFEELLVAITGLDGTVEPAGVVTCLSQQAAIDKNIVAHGAQVRGL